MMQTRRGFLAAAAASALLPCLPAPALAVPPDFRRSAWSAPAGDFDLDGLEVRGRWPAGLALTFYRNGPGLHTLGGYRYRHWFDGDGMVQAWTVTPGGARLRTRLVRTAKLGREQAAGRRLVPGFGSLPPDVAPGSGADDMNPANINALPFAGSLLALWEAGSAYRLDPGTLETLGPVAWSPETAGLPFSGHPHADASGTLWNFGLGYDGRLVVWEIAPDGSLRRCRVLDVGYAGLMHDFAVTARHLLFVMPPLVVDRDRVGRTAFLKSLAWRPEQGLRLLLVDKADLRVVRETAVPARFVFHLGDAREDGDGTVSGDIVTYPDPMVVTEDLAAVMDGALPRRFESRFERLVWPAAGPARLEPRIAEAGVEFPRWAGTEGGTGGSVLMHADAGRRAGWFDTVLAVDRETGVTARWTAPERVLLEEHVPAGADGRHVVGTGIDALSGHSFLHLFDAGRIADGPVAWVELPMALPPGLHANVRLG
ncbi:carotenoid oxygenase family protein [Skermanella mucosa]|uniref:carotenoid oxygenase family protein n=1 Tax=Skermanella mucosa TaxID=1789672 RepID=UPI00192B8BE9|nr:carotenoid oxygenase family protein [Skermanella mucosa]UEM20571.1 carotenoid oxygenase family protein [Skermanella mucosa]